jgi:aminoglycoside phosphotransferase (APT) family kinase protein
MVARAVDGLISLGVATARPVAGTALAAAFATLMDRYVALHQPPIDARRALGRSLDGIAAARTIPVVAQHGDPGTWNLLAMPDGRVGVLDWEAFEPAGPPLWDLWHLLRSVLLDVRSSLPRRRSSILGSAFLTRGAGNDLVADATARYRRALDLDPGLVVPLFAFGWLHRALKESTRSRPADVGAGHYARFVASVIADLDAPGLRRLSERDPA